MKKLTLILVLFLLTHFSYAEEMSSSYTIYSYHPDAPFYLPRQPLDLTRAWVDLFNKQETGIQLKLIQVSRPVLNQIVENKQPYLIIWANPIWFKSRDPNVMATNNIFWDADILVSLPQKPINYSAPEDLQGLRIGGRNGYFYKGINPLVKEGKIKRLNQLTDQENFYQLTANKVDAFIMSRSSYLYWQYSDASKKNLFVAISPHDAYTRHILVSSQNKHLVTPLNQFIEQLEEDKTWQNYLKTWGVEELITPFELELDELQKY